MGTPSIQQHGPRREAGFTISELVLVVAVVVALLGIATVSLRGIRDHASDSECRTELRTLKVQTERYFAENAVYPPNVNALVAKQLVKADEIPDFELAGGGAGTPPSYEAIGDCTGSL